MMFGKKQKIKLSENLKLGVQRPGSQPMFFKMGGVILLVLSALLAGNIYNKTKDNGKNYNAGITANENTATVLGAFDSKADLKPKIINYKIKKGDTLFNIAQNHNINWQNIVDLNNLKAPYILKPGDSLKIPSPE